MAGIRICYRPSLEKLRKEMDEILAQAGMSMVDISAVMTGVNGHPSHDRQYRETIVQLFPHQPLLHYKHLFGENYTVSALGIYAAAHLLKKQEIPSFIYDHDSLPVDGKLNSILLLNMTESGECSLILLKRI
jgi:3-oxoacyl-(acyl-carrier-protein) synthase